AAAVLRRWSRTGARRRCLAIGGAFACADLTCGSASAQQKYLPSRRNHRQGSLRPAPSDQYQPAQAGNSQRHLKYSSFAAASSAAGRRLLQLLAAAQQRCIAPALVLASTVPPMK